MPLIVTCGQCGQRFAVAPHLYGQRVPCTNCRGLLEIPVPPPAAAPRGAIPAPNAAVGGAQPTVAPRRAASASLDNKKLVVLCAVVGGGTLLVLLGAILVASVRSGGADRSAPSAPDPPDDRERARIVQQDVRRITEAAQTGDIDTVVEYTHPRLMELAGGEENIRSVAERALALMREAEMQFESLTFPSAPTFLKSAENEFVIVPVLIVMTTKGLRLESTTFQLGARPCGTAKWRYLEGGRINRESVRLFFPDFPADGQLPTTSRRRI